MKTTHCQEPRDKGWKKTHDWKEKLLSRGETKVLIKAVLEAISSRATSIYHLPMQLCHDIHSIIQKFWWGSSLSGKGVT